MSGLAEILDENERLRKEMAALRASIQERNDHVRERDEQIRERDDELERTRAELAHRTSMIEALQLSAEDLARQLEFLKLQVVRPASQRFISEAQDLLPFPADVAPPPRAPIIEDTEEPQPETEKKRRRTPKRRNREDFRDLRSREVRCRASSETCFRCGEPLAIIGKTQSFRINWVPGHFVVDDVVRDKCSCSSCPGEGVLTVPAPYALPRALCADGLLARVLVDKFADHIPLNRQAKRMGREGFEIGSNTLANWTKLGGGLLSVLATAVRAELLSKSFLQGDDTGMPVQDGGNGALRKARMWVFTDQQQAYYAVTDSKEGKFPSQILEGFKGDLLLVDGGSEFNQVVSEQGLERGGCWSHLRTYFFHALQYNPTEAGVALRRIRDLFMIERVLWGKPPDEVVALRREHAAPVIDGLFTWIEAISTMVRPESKLGKAVTYARNQEAHLRLHLEHGEMPMHNNLSELMLRQNVVGRKNWLFARSEGGAQVAATAYTLIQSCMLQGIDPHTYLVDVLGRLQDHPANRVGELTPLNWRLARENHPTQTG